MVESHRGSRSYRTVCVKAPSEPELQSWGLIVAYVIDPSGELWHFAAERTENG